MDDNKLFIKSIDDSISDLINMNRKGIIRNRLSLLEVHNLRYFIPGTKLNFSFPITILVGKNGSGKTTIMKSIKMLSKGNIPQNEFFETEIDDGGFKNADISYEIDDSNISFKRIRKNEWGKEGIIPSNINIVYLKTKSMVGATEKSFLYDDIGKNTKQIQKVEYVIKQSKKISQNANDFSARKKSYYFNDDAIKAVNFIIQGNIKSIEFIEHKYFSGTWGTTIIFDEGVKYTEYNAGSGEYVIANIVNNVQNISDNSILLLDEPEVSLHPGAQKRLIRYILDVIKRKRLQVIVSTHSPCIVENMPSDAIKCLRKIPNGKIVIDEHVQYQKAFVELEADLTNKKHIIVEDKMAKMILEYVARKEKIEDLVEIEFYPGGASYIKTDIIFPYSKTGVKNRYFILDGDQKPDDLDWEKLCDDNSLKDMIIKVAGTENLRWGINANRKAGRYDEELKKTLARRFLKFYKNHVFYLPMSIPEEIIYDENEIKSTLKLDVLPVHDDNKNSKECLKYISDTIGYSYDALEKHLCFCFARNNTSENYLWINSIMNSIVNAKD